MTYKGIRRLTWFLPLHSCHSINKTGPYIVIHMDSGTLKQIDLVMNRKGHTDYYEDRALRSTTGLVLSNWSLK